MIPVANGIIRVCSDFGTSRQWPSWVPRVAARRGLNTYAFAARRPGIFIDDLRHSNHALLFGLAGAVYQHIGDRSGGFFSLLFPNDQPRFGRAVQHLRDAGDNAVPDWDRQRQRRLRRRKCRRGADTTFSTNDGATIGGDVYEDVGVTSSITNTTIGGALYQAAGVTSAIASSTFQGGVISPADVNLGPATADAETAVMTATNLSQNPNNSLSSGNTITGLPVNVVNLTGLFLSGTTLTISGTSSEQFLFNVSLGLFSTM